jgi:hypothetical protein
VPDRQAEERGHHFGFAPSLAEWYFDGRHPLRPGLERREDRREERREGRQERRDERQERRDGRRGGPTQQGASAESTTYDDTPDAAVDEGLEPETTRPPYPGSTPSFQGRGVERPIGDMPENQEVEEEDLPPASEEPEPQETTGPTPKQKGPPGITPKPAQQSASRRR